jgi:hypothetical protein
MGGQKGGETGKSTRLCFQALSRNSLGLDVKIGHSRAAKQTQRSKPYKELTIQCEQRSHKYSLEMGAFEYEICFGHSYGTVFAMT